MVKVRVGVRAEVWVKVWVGHLAVVQQEHEQREETLQRRLGQLPPVWAQQLDLRGKHHPSKVRPELPRAGLTSALEDAWSSS